jgi:FemAB-related protein (PEP-CTERM system-associated)
MMSIALQDKISCPATQVYCKRRPPLGWNAYLRKWGMEGFHQRAEWARVFEASLLHQAWFVWTERDGQVTGALPLMLIRGPLFGRFLVSQPYLNTGGALADSAEFESRLIGRAVQLADSLDVKRMELRHERQMSHSSLNEVSTEKVHMRLALPESTDALWDGLKSKVRSQIRKPLNDASLQVSFGRLAELDAFYTVFCHNMRDLGTPPFSQTLFAGMLQEFTDEAEICTVRHNGIPVASGFLLHGPGTTLIPSASSLRKFNTTSCNMLMYWHMLSRSVERGQHWFDFGRSSSNSGTYRFKKQFGSQECPAVWQYYNRLGAANDMRPGSGRFDRLIGVWKKLPVCVTQLIGPMIVRGIP